MSTSDLPITRAEVIRASAGSGKTYVLVQRYLSLLLHGESPRTILASTFTVRAAGEIRERVLRRIAEAVRNPEARHRMEQEFGQAISQARIELLLGQTISELAHAAICTLDALVAKIAGGLTIECGLPLGWRMSELPGLSRELGSELVTLQARELGKLLSMIVRSDASRRIAQPLIETCLRFHEQLQVYGAQAFFIGNSEKLDLPIRAWASGISSIPLPLTKTKTPRTHFSRAIETLKTALQNEDLSGLFTLPLIQRALERSSFDREDLSSETYEPLWELAERLRAYEKTRLVERSQVLLMVLAHFDDLYRSHQHRSGLVKHSDLLLAVARYMAEDTLSGVAYALDQRFSHILLDEFQDTSPLQWRVLRPFLKEILGDSARNRTAFIVGDPKQAIYGWRGGSAAIFDEVTESLPADWNERALAESYRSSAVVLDFVNRVFQNLQPVKSEYACVADQFRSAFTTHRATRELPGRVTFSVSEQSASEWVRSTIEGIFAVNTNATVGILTRRNDTVVEIVRELRHAGISAVGDGKAGSERTVPVEAIKYLLHYSLHPADSEARFIVEQSGILGDGESIDVAVRTACSPQLIQRLVRLHRSGRLTAEQARDIELAIGALADGIERGANARELIALLQTQPLSGGKGQVSVMTMHRAKGLEFEYVLLPELDQKLIRNVPPGMLTWQEPDGTYRVTPYMSEEHQQVDPRFSAADLEMRKAETAEALCLMYVALTRAVSELHLFSPVVSRKGKERDVSEPDIAAPPFTMAGIIAASLGLSLATPDVIFDTKQPN